MDDAILLKHLTGLLDETWHGMASADLPEGWSYYSDQNAGLEQSLAGLTVEQAGRTLGTTSIAQHAKHTAVGARIFAAWIRGEQPAEDWDASWQLDALDDAGWEALKADLWAALGALRTVVVEHAASSDLTLASSMGAVAHCVYHLGAIRSKLTQLS